VEIIMMKSVCVLGAAVLLCGLTIEVGQAGEKPEVLNHSVKDIDGKEVKLSDYQGKVILVVNVASKCGMTPQYKGLQAVYEKYKDKGLVVLGFPCNQFGKQEPGDEIAIKEFCSNKYHVTFPMFAKINVNGDNTNDFYKSLKASKPGDIKWNFEKFLINKKGEVVSRFGTRTEPESGEIINAIETELKK
jgi:glutathione peroxidase